MDDARGWGDDAAGRPRIALVGIRRRARVGIDFLTGIHDRVVTLDGTTLRWMRIAAVGAEKSR